MFSAYAAGLRVSDMLVLRWTDIQGDKLVKQVRKTKETISFKLPRIARIILQYYERFKSSDNGLVFPLLSEEDFTTPQALHSAISSRTAYINKDLLWIAVKAEISKHMTIHTARHTFATRALKRGVRIEYVSKLLGHASIKTTQIYAKIMSDDLDKAMSLMDD